ncbi:MAG: flagellar hook-basal body complex protein [Rhodospirillales bacterium]
MTGFGLFQASVLGMQSQSQALSVIGGNVANVNTTGYKRAESEFATLLSRTYAGDAGTDGTGPLSQQSDLGGVVTRIVNRVGDQGELSSTGRDLDMAIDGPGLFVLADTTSGQRLFSRNGRFNEILGPEITATGTDGSPITTNARYLADGNGYALQGWRVGADGSFSNDPAALTSVRTDAYAFASDVRATTTASVPLNLPAGDAVGASEGFIFDVYDSTGTARTLTANFTKTATNSWQLAVTGPNGETATVNPATLAFTSTGALAGPASFQVSLDHGGGATSSFTFDLAGTTQFNGDLTLGDPTVDGHGAGVLDSVSFDGEGYVVGHFSNGTEQRIWRLPIADFANAEGLTALSGNVYAAGPDSGNPVYNAAGQNGSGGVTASAVELSNVDLADQFSKMIQTQNAYNSSATAFRTLDEVMQIARDLKR